MKIGRTKSKDMLGELGLLGSSSILASQGREGRAGKICFTKGSQRAKDIQVIPSSTNNTPKKMISQRYPQDGPKMSPRCTKDVPKISTRCPNDVPKMFFSTLIRFQNLKFKIPVIFSCPELLFFICSIGDLVLWSVCLSGTTNNQSLQNITE